MLFTFTEIVINNPLKVSSSFSMSICGMINEKLILNEIFTSIMEDHLIPSNQSGDSYIKQFVVVVVASLIYFGKNYTIVIEIIQFAMSI